MRLTELFGSTIALSARRAPLKMTINNFEIRWTANRHAFANCYPGPPRPGFVRSDDSAGSSPAPAGLAPGG
jgi:hypothetical protein